MRWKVMSDKDAYSVDLAEDTCTCNHWVYRLSRNKGDARRCKHINIARGHLLDMFISYEKNVDRR